MALGALATAAPDEAERLMAEGHRPGPVGRELESARPVEVRLSAGTLAATCLALVPSESEAAAPG